MAYIDFHPTIRAMGDEACAAAIIEGTITSFADESLLTLGASSLSGCASLEDIKTPATTTFNGRAMAKTSVSTVIVRNRSYIYEEVFEGCANLTALILCGNWRTYLTSQSAFNNTPIASGNGYIYVPKKMDNGTDGVASYSADTNWSVFAGQFRYIEDYPEILTKVKEVAPWY